MSTNSPAPALVLSGVAGVDDVAEPALFPAAGLESEPEPLLDVPELEGLLEFELVDDMARALNAAKVLLPFAGLDICM